MANPLAKYITKGVTDAFSKKGRLSKAQNALVTRQANKANMSVSEFKAAVKKEIKTSDKPKKQKGDASAHRKNLEEGDTTGLTKAQKAERRRLIKRSKDDYKKSRAEQEGKTTVKEPDRIKLTAGGTEVLPSKEQIDPKIRSYSKARIRHLIKTGQAKMVVDKNGKRSIITTGKFASPQSMVADEMGLSNKGVLPTEKEAQAMGMSIKSFKSGSGKKTIGMVKKNIGGPVHGVGQAMRGFGKAKYSKKMY